MSDLVDRLKKLASEAKPRDHHYFFAHRLLPKVVFENPERFFDCLVDDGDGFLSWLWERCDLYLDSSAHLPSDGLSFSMGRLDTDTIIALIEMPPPIGVTEAFLIAVAHRPEQQQFLRTQPGLTRYFTLELGEHLDDGVRTVLCEWTSNRTHANFGNGPIPARDAFLQAVAGLLQAGQSTPPN